MIEVYYMMGYGEDLVYVKDGHFKFSTSNRKEWVPDNEPQLKDLTDYYVKLFEIEG